MSTSFVPKGRNESTLEDLGYESLRLRRYLFCCSQLLKFITGETSLWLYLQSHLADFSVLRDVSHPAVARGNSPKHWFTLRFFPRALSQPTPRLMSGEDTTTEGKSTCTSLSNRPKANTDVGKVTPNLEKNKYIHIGARREKY